MAPGAWKRTERALPLVLLAAMLAGGAVLSRSQLNLINFIAIFTIAVLGMGLLLGYAGQISLGQAGFMAVGAYTTTIATTKFGLPPVAGVLLAMVACAVLAVALGRVVLRLKGYFLALATLALGEIIFVVLREWVDLTGGPSGMYNIPSLSIGGLQFDSYRSFYYLVVILTALLMLFQRNLLRSRTGRALQAIQDGEVAAESVSIDVMGYKVLAFVLSAVLAGLSGALYAHYVQFISPEGFGMVVSIELLIMIMIGSPRSIYGPALGVIVFFLSKDYLEHFLPKVFPQAGSQMVMVFFSIILILIVIFAPHGIIPAVGDLLGQRRKKAV